MMRRASSQMSWSLQVAVPETVFAGRPFKVDVTVLDASNQRASGFTDTVTDVTPAGGRSAPAGM